FPEMEADGLDTIRAETPRQICPDTGQMLIPIQGFLLKIPDHVILVDTCVGNDKTFPQVPQWQGRSGTRFLAALQAAGVTPDDVTHVLCTHIHIDHIGWNTRLEAGRWVPTFPTARYLLPKADCDQLAAEKSPLFTESVLPVVEAGQAELVEGDRRIGDFVEIVPTPGHTAGHVSVLVQAAGRKAMIAGDAIHSTVQCGRPHWTFRYDFDKALAVRTRRKLLEEAAADGRLFIASHFLLPSLGRVEAQGDVFRWAEA
ncbi:MAG: MBL fold metallo-hydrolase, partial [Pseudomonadota bacterium]